MDLFEKLLGQIVAVQSVWFPFLLSISIATALVWRAVDFAYKTRLSNADSTQVLLERQLQEYKDKLSGATPDQAKARLDALEARVNMLAPRQISAEQRERMARTLGKYQGAVASIFQDAASAEAAILARGIAAAFQTSGWIVHSPMIMGVKNPPPSGIRLEVANTEALTAPENAAAEALRAVGLEFDLEKTTPRHFDAHPAVSILVSSRIQG